jgi:hypothetical protein
MMSCPDVHPATEFRRDDTGDAEGQGCAAARTGDAMDKRTRVREAFLRERNIEPVARALCAKELGAVRSVSADDVPGLVDRLWPAVAAQLAAGLRNDAGNTVPHSVAVGLAAWEDWLDSRPAAR